MLAMGYTSGVLGLGGCAGAPWPSNGKLPERVVDKLTDCGKKGPTPIESTSYDLTFAVHVTEDDHEARVDDVMLTASTLHLHEVEACMTDALYGMRTPLEALALRRRQLSPDPTVAPETRALLGQAQVALLLEAVALVVVGYAAYTVVVQLIVDKRRTKLRPRPVTAETEEPPVPVASAAPTAIAPPIAPTVPTAVPLPTQAPKPIGTALPMPPFETEIESKCMPLLRECLGNKAQPKWNRKDFGNQKNCQACFEECKHKKGVWPTYKCPRN